MTNSQSNLNSEQHIADILPLVETPERKVPSTERTTFKLNTNPAEATSPKMDFNVNHLTGTETTREVITFIARVRESSRQVSALRKKSKWLNSIPLS